VRRAVFVLALCGCSSKPSAVAVLDKADGTVERQQDGAQDWKAAQPNTPYFLGDAAHTADKSTADLSLGVAARIHMLHSTSLRFRGKPGKVEIAVEAGAIDLAGSGTYALDVGSVAMAAAGGGTVRITAKGNGASSVELTLGQAKLAGTSQTVDLVLGQPKELDKAGVLVAPVDAGVPDAPAPADAGGEAAADATVEQAGAAMIEVTGKRAESLAPGATAWKSLPPGPGSLAKSSAVRLGIATTARLVANSTVLELSGSTRVKLGEDLGFAIEQGLTSAEAAAPATIAVPAGAFALAGVPGAPAQARIEVSPRDSRITMVRGRGTLTGAAGASLVLNRGESAWLTRTGAIRSVDAIPTYFDLRVVAGESLTIHDPKPPTAVQFQFDGKCADGGIIEVDRDGRFRTAKVSAGREFANVMVGVGDLSYRLRCSANGVDGSAVASGRIVARRDDGRRPLTKYQPVNDIDADGRNYRISYQSAIPSVVVHVANAGRTTRLHLAAAGKEQTFDSTTQTVTLPGVQLHEGTYSYWLDRDGVKQDKVSTLTIDFDQTAPQVYIESPVNGQPWAGDIDVRGAVLPGWSAAVEAIAVPVDSQRRFSAKVGIPAGNALAIRLSHPQRGVHYYLRRAK
jgi:hypothetical protein